MDSQVALVDYGAGNLHSVENALRAVGAHVAVTHNPEAIAKADRIVLPGVGSFRSCAEGLRSIDGMIEALEQRVRGDSVPFLGVCVGMQLLATRGLEHGETPGLDWIAGEVRAIEPPNPSIKVPHMGWNDVVPNNGSTYPIEAGEAYFLHSYAYHPVDPSHVAATTGHGGKIVAAVAKDNVLGVQFHPEKSQKYGLELLRGFLAWSP